MPCVLVCFSRGTAASFQTLPCMPVPDIPACGRAGDCTISCPTCLAPLCFLVVVVCLLSLTHLLSKIKPTQHQKLPLDSTFHSLTHACSFHLFPPYSAFAVGVCCSSHCVCVPGGSTSAPAVCITARMQAETKSPLQTRSQKHKEACNKENKTKMLLKTSMGFFSVKLFYEVVFF